jgi:hypothetical protein
LTVQFNGSAAFHAPVQNRMMIACAALTDSPVVFQNMSSAALAVKRHGDECKILLRRRMIMLVLHKITSCLKY